MKNGVCGKKLKENRNLRWTMGSCSAAGSYFLVRRDVGAILELRVGWRR